ncbi:type II toxin-antitoxin system HicA family toxin [Vulgatibacter sp.]|uniref:type II toxin-antitoxin system HicA family toxin n=1 Tax=Vulgatibacter sp. TaxID=1971226 RepID=UPI0035630B45
MTRRAKLEAAIRNNPRNVRFADLCRLLEHAGFRLERTRGSHHVFRRAGLPLVNLQATSDGRAKAYQVEQVLSMLDEMEAGK